MGNNIITTALNEVKENFLAIATDEISYEKERSFAIQILKNNSYLLQAAQKNPHSLQAAVINVASIGLSLNPAEKQAYLIPRNVKVAQNKWETRVFLEPSYMGLLRLATNSGSIEWVQANVIYANDKFIDHGPGEKPTIEYQAFTDRGEFVGAYCTAKTSGGDFITNTMDVKQIYSIRERSEAWKNAKSRPSCPWATDFVEMARKTVIRQSFKYWPSSNERLMSAAVELSNENEGFEPILTSPEIPPVAAGQKEYFDQLITSSDACGMFLFTNSIEDADFATLYNSFEKGTKGKYQKIIEDLKAKGREQMTFFVDTIKHACSENDDSTLLESVEELSTEQLEFVKNNLSNEELFQLNEVVK